MNAKREDVPLVELLDHDTRLGMEELCRACELSREELLTWVAEGVAEPRDAGAGEWHFSLRQFRRLRTARRLRRDLDVVPSDLPLVLDLIEELEQLRRRVRSLERLLDAS
ncbi:chaperone modulator CbpM [Wenzhouxiangella marina]|uniref:Uncharacterized protein n=1 Tax=Wenzhouxiangella marina TaxID=1579979 RepID=A0A0K0XV81_9GAMM|nr:chaperone modulator CbpM [Wenzhouxiangella marina]AKS41619.1 hypothetical protein WM2015_1245 [Wenzhouxiangella marina]MBB6086622.1 chaperone modulatory protein CbpM [Wenzhouxiangella marina]